MMHPLHDGTIDREGGLASVTTCSPQSAPDQSIRFRDLGSGCPVVVAALSDATAAHFFETCYQQDHPITWISYEDLQDDSIAFEAFINAINNAPGVYFREVREQTEDDAFLGATVRAVVKQNENLLGPPRSTTNSNKPLHLKNLRAPAELPVTVPRTQIVSRIEQGEGMVMKALSGFPAFTLDAGAHEGCDGVGPLLLQEYLMGDELRIHVVDSHFVSHLLEKNDGVDYRVTGLAGLERVSLSSDVRDVLRGMMETEGVRFGGFDVIRSEHRFIVLELNPMPGYHSYEVRDDGNPITKVIYRTLTSNGELH